jgi:hypothetical protein
MTPLLRNRLARKQRLSLAVLLLLVLAASMMLLAIPPAYSGSHAGARDLSELPPDRRLENPLRNRRSLRRRHC